MGTGNAFYVKASTDNEWLKFVINKRFPCAKLEPGTPFLGVFLLPEQQQPPQQDLAEISLRLNTDVIWLSFQTVVDAFEFHHWRSGDLVRSLVYGCYKEERTWEIVEGAPEPWEEKVFFHPERLKIPLEFAEDKNRAEELRRIWKNAELLPGRTEPGLSAGDCARQIAGIYAFPRWGAVKG